MTGAHPTVNGGPHLRTVDIGDTPTEQLSLIPKDDGTPVGRAIEELIPALANFKTPVEESIYVPSATLLHFSLSSVTFCPSNKNANTETGDNEDGNHIGEAYL